MPEDIDYDSLVDGTIDEVKEQLEERDDLDYDRVLEAEEDNKNRKTLKSWLKQRKEEADEDEETEPDEDDTGEVSAFDESDDLVDRETQSVWELPVTNFVFGLVIGLAVAAAFVHFQGDPTGSGMAEVTADQAADRAPAIMRQQMENLVPPNMTVDISAGSVDTETYGDLFVVPMTMQAGPQEQEVQAYVTRQSGMLFLSPIDLESGEPIGQQQAPAQ